MGKCIPLSIEERKEIYRLLHAGHNASHIAKLMNRSKNGITTEIRKNGGALNYNFIKASEEAEKRRAERYKQLSEKFKGRVFSPNYSKKIQNLEFQIEILHETLKELMNENK